MVVPDEDVDATATSLTERLATGASRSIGVAKRLIYEGYESSLEEAGDSKHEIVKSIAVDGKGISIASRANRNTEANDSLGGRATVAVNSLMVGAMMSLTERTSSIRPAT